MYRSDCAFLVPLVWVSTAPQNSHAVHALGSVHTMKLSTKPLAWYPLPLRLAPNCWETNHVVRWQSWRRLGVQRTTGFLLPGEFATRRGRGTCNAKPSIQTVVWGCCIPILVGA